jgi:hypothetical protein
MEKRPPPSDWPAGEWALFYTILVMALGLMIALLGAISFIGCINNWLYHCIPTTAFVDFAAIWLIPLLLTWAPPFFLFVGKSSSQGMKQFIVAYAVICLLFITFELASALYGIIVIWVPSNTSSASFSVGIFAATIIMLILWVIQIAQLFFASYLLAMPDVGWRPYNNRAHNDEKEEELEMLARRIDNPNNSRNALARRLVADSASF